MGRQAAECGVLNTGMPGVTTNSALCRERERSSRITSQITATFSGFKLVNDCHEQGSSSTIVLSLKCVNPPINESSPNHCLTFDMFWHRLSQLLNKTSYSHIAV